MVTRFSNLVDLRRKYIYVVEDKPTKQRQKLTNTRFVRVKSRAIEEIWLTCTSARRENHTFAGRVWRVDGDGAS